MDFREFYFWLKSARIKLLRDQIDSIVCARVAMSEKRGYEQTLSTLKSEIESFSVPRNKLLKKNWEDLVDLHKRRR